MPRDEDDDRYDDERPRKKRLSRDNDEDDRDERDEKPRKRSAPAESNNLAMIGLILGVLSLFCLGVTGPFAFLLGILGVMKANKTGTGKGMAFGAIALGAIGTLMMIGAGVGLFYLFTTGRKKIQEAAGNQQLNNNYKQIGLGMHNYESANAYFPTADAPAIGVKPAPADVTQRLSWRASILPYIEEERVYRMIKFDEAWNSPGNNPATSTPIRNYAEIDTPNSNQTRVRVFVGNGALFDAPPLAKGGAGMQRTRGIVIPSITDGTSNTIMAVEAAQTVPWGQYNELPFDPRGNLPQLGRADKDVFMVIMCDGSVRNVRKNMDPATLKAMITRAGGEVVPFIP
jgi:hypothetical protein